MTSFLVQPDELTRIVQAVQRSTAKDDERPVLTGIFLKLEGETLTAVAADGFRLSLSEARVNDGYDSASAILTKAPLLAFLKLCGGKKVLAYASITPGEDVWTFACRGQEMRVPVIDGTYPDYRQIVGDADNLNHMFRANATYLAEILSAHKGEMVSFSVLGDGKPGYAAIHITRQDTFTGPLTRHVVMPMVVGAR